MTEREYAMCYKKHGFPTRAKANSALKRLKKTKVGRVNAYRCPYCGLWHIGRVNKGVENATKESSDRKSWRSEIGSE